LPSRERDRKCDKENGTNCKKKEKLSSWGKEYPESSLYPCNFNFLQLFNYFKIKH
jgi:hypothetical protein